MGNSTIKMMRVEEARSTITNPDINNGITKEKGMIS